MADWPDPPINSSPDARGSAAGGRVTTQQDSGGGWPDAPAGHASQWQPKSYGGWPDPPVGASGSPREEGGSGGKPTAAPPATDPKRQPLAKEGLGVSSKGSAASRDDGTIARGSAHATVQPELGETGDPWEKSNVEQRSISSQVMMPATQWWPTYSRMVNESLHQTSESFNALFHDKTWGARGVDALSTVAHGAAATVGDPISTTWETLVGGPVQSATGGMLPKDKKIMGMQVTSKEGGLAKETTDTVGQLATPFLSAKTAVGGAISAAGNSARSAVSGIPETSFIVSARSVISPGGLGTDAKEAAQSIRANWAQLARRGDQARAKMDQFSGAMAKMPQSVQLDFIHRVENGLKQPTPELQQAADTMRGLLDDRWREVNALGKLDAYIDDYFPHFWKDADTSGKMGASGKGGVKPLLGSQEFRKKRTMPTTQDGIAAGLEPVTTNPVDLTLMKLKSMDRLIIGTHIVNEMKSQGLLKFFKGQLPDGWRKIDDPIANVTYINDQGERVIAGQYAAPENASRVINNHLSSSALKGHDPVKWTRMAGNLMNMSQLSFSAFHAGFITMDAMASKTSLAVEQFARGQFGKSIKTYLGMPGAPVSNLIKGRQIRSAWLNPQNATPELQAMADAVEAGGGRISMDSLYKATPSGSLWKSMKNGTLTKEVKEAFADHPWKAPMEMVSRTLESTGSWLMEYYVPRMKLGVFHDMAQDVIRRNPGMSPTELRESLQKTWASVDNRMGQLVYDNLLWNRTLRDSSHLAIRAVGWTLGTIRELGGGGLDMLKSADDFLAGNGFELSHRTAYLAGITANTALISSVYQYLHTGHGPTELRDYFFPRTGAKDPKYGFDERVSLPSYMKDIAEYNQDVTGTLSSKIHPMWKSAYEMMNNRDFFGAAIVNRDDDWQKQLKDLGVYLKDQYTPFNWKESASRRRPAVEDGRLEQFFGVQKAPLRIGSPETADALANKYDTKLALKKKAKEEQRGDR